ncbi:solute carrier family 28 member 3-like isoform X2 [Ptychodera flava]|uniref:solute carrier family 28 member 3-like isoform X2 n=1 Tax=Ptychodera flava TaxID=63121 RepID=UPI00396A85F5
MLEMANDDSTVHKRELTEDGKSHRTITGCIITTIELVKMSIQRHQVQLWYSINSILGLSYSAFLIYACYRSFYDAMTLFVFTGLTLMYLLYTIIRDKTGACLVPVIQLINKYQTVIKRFLYIILLGGLSIFIIMDTRHARNQLISAVGFVSIIIFCFVCSKNHSKILWRQVVWGILLQFFLGLFILRTVAGYELFQWLGSAIAYFFTFSNYGAEFVFGDNFEDHYFAFKVLPVIIYFSSVINVLYYLGVIKFCVSKLAWLLHRTMQTSAVESFNAAGNIFIGQVETVFLIRPFLHDMTSSELHAVLTGGFSTMSGDATGVYAPLGIDPMHIISASVMSAPAALAISKLFYPEDKKTKYITSENVNENISKSKDRNLLEAVSHGATMAISSVSMIAANLIAFIALLELLNNLLAWIGAMVGIPQLSFELICSYVFMPVAFSIGVEWDDCQVVAELIGLKIFINEFVAYVRLSEIIENGKIGEEPSISTRSEVLATYILCGFDNIASMGIMLACLSSLIPERKSELAKIITRSLIAGSCTCFLTACIAGTLIIMIHSSIEALKSISHSISLG